MILRRLKQWSRNIKQKYVLLLLVLTIVIIYIELRILPRYNTTGETMSQQKVQDDRQLYVYHFGRYIPFTKTELVTMGDTPTDKIHDNSEKLSTKKYGFVRNKHFTSDLVPKNRNNKKRPEIGDNDLDSISLENDDVRLENPTNELENPDNKKRSEIQTNSPKTTTTTTTRAKPFILSTRSKQRQCTFKQHPFFPFCTSKVNFLKHFWSKDLCFQEHHHVDGSDCSIYKYLTEIEPYCAGDETIYARKSLGVASMNYDLNGLLGLYQHKDYAWMRDRTSYMWPSWLSGAKTYSALRAKRHREIKNILVYPGSLAANHFLFDQAGKGGPLGELIQWSDLTAALHVLGYNVTFVTEMEDLRRVMQSNKTKCAIGVNKANIDVIYTDINGFYLLTNGLGSSSLAKYRCMLRILDTFGTFPEFNFPGYPHKIPGGRAGWSNLNLIPTQFLTLYPHTTDNRFLGFVIPEKVKKKKSKYNENDNTALPRLQKALLYAKRASYIKGYEKYLRVVSEYFDIHSTCLEDYSLPSFIHNHGPVSTERVQEMLSNSKVFLGVGFPYEGPGPLEAMANGAIYIQPKFNVPINKLNNKFFGGKPNLRKLTSQNPYMEEFVGEPYCYTIDTNDEQLVRATLDTIKAMKHLPPKIPKEFTHIGFIERVHAFTEYIDYCNPHAPAWPPLDHLRTFVSAPGQSCADLCRSKGLICERTFFNEINKAAIIEQLGRVHCSEVKLLTALHPPSVSVSTKTCYIQNQQQTFSCMHSEESITRICPCRDYDEEQSAICHNCL